MKSFLRKFVPCMIGAIALAIGGKLQGVTLETTLVTSYDYTMYKGIINMVFETYDPTWANIEDRYERSQRIYYPDGTSVEKYQNAQFDILTTAYWNSWENSTPDGLWTNNGWAYSQLYLANPDTSPKTVDVTVDWGSLSPYLKCMIIPPEWIETRTITVNPPGVVFAPPSSGRVIHEGHMISLR